MSGKLFEPMQLGAISLKNRVAMAPLTRGRADKDRAPQAFVADYYAQRASVGLIIAEATAVSQEGAGWRNAPGLYTEKQQQAWRHVTDAARAAGAPMLVQIWHMGRQVHPDFLDGQQPVAPSAIVGEGEIAGPDGVARPFVMPRALETDEIPERVQQFVRAAEAAVASGFEGVEIHAANGFLIEQFLRDGANRRKDKYGGSRENRARFLFEVVDACAAAIGRDRIGVRISPTAILWGLDDSNLEQTYKVAVEGLSERNIAYLHVLEPPAGTDHFLSSERPPLAPKIRRWFNGTLILNGGYTRETAQRALNSGAADAIAFGSPMIANPDFVTRMQRGYPLAAANPDLFYTNDREGYVDYPPYSSSDEGTVANAA